MLSKCGQEHHVKDEFRQMLFLIEKDNKGNNVFSAFCVKNLQQKKESVTNFYRIVLKKKLTFVVYYIDYSSLFHITLTVLKYSIPEDIKASATSLVVTTHDIGCPLPMGFPIVTMSGTKSSP